MSSRAEFWKKFLKFLFNSSDRLDKIQCNLKFLYLRVIFLTFNIDPQHLEHEFQIEIF